MWILKTKEDFGGRWLGGWVEFLFSSWGKLELWAQKTNFWNKNLSVGHLGCLYVGRVLGGQLWDLPGLFLGLVWPGYLESGLTVGVFVGLPGSWRVKKYFPCQLLPNQVCCWVENKFLCVWVTPVWCNLVLFGDISKNVDHKKTDFQPCVAHEPELVSRFWNNKERVYNQNSEGVLGGVLKVAGSWWNRVSKTENCWFLGKSNWPCLTISNSLQNRF